MVELVRQEPLSHTESGNSYLCHLNEQCKCSHLIDGKTEARRGNKVMGMFLNGQGEQSAMI